MAVTQTILSAPSQGGAISRSPGGGLETAVPCKALAVTISLREKSDPAATLLRSPPFP
jgi:hypothetical protein